MHMIINEFETNSRTELDFSNVVQINPPSYIEEKERADSIYALNWELLGLAVITLGPIFVQLVNLVEKTKEKRKEYIDSDTFVGDDI